LINFFIVVNNSLVKNIPVRNIINQVYLYFYSFINLALKNDIISD